MGNWIIERDNDDKYWIAKEENEESFFVNETLFGLLKRIKEINPYDVFTFSLFYLNSLVSEITNMEQEK